MNPPHEADFAARADWTHLTDDQIDDELIGDLGLPGSDHLAACDLCVARVAEAGAPLADFKTVTLAWAERRSATLPLHQEIVRSARFHPSVAWAAAISVAMAVGFVIPVVSHRERNEVAQVAGHAAPGRSQDSGIETASGPTELADGSASSQAQIVRDNQMLQAIDRELDSSVEGPETLGLQPVTSSAASKPIPPEPLQD